jgi:exosortase
MSDAALRLGGSAGVHGLSPWRIEFGRSAQLKAALIAGLFILTFWNTIYLLAYTWWNQPADWGHGWIIPAFSAYFVYNHWDRVKATPIRHTWVGLLLIVVSLAFYWLNLWAFRIGYLQSVGMLLCLLGIVIFLCGLPVVRHIWVPWLYLFFAVPLPHGVYFNLTDPLRKFAAYGATIVLRVFGLQIERVGSTIEYVHAGTVGKLEVADACAGMRSTITLCALGVAIAFVQDRPWWQRIVMIASCVPIAIFANFIRVTTTCVLHVYVDPVYAKGNYHTMLGLLTLGLAFLMFNGLSWILAHATPTDADDADEAESPA